MTSRKLYPSELKRLTPQIIHPDRRMVFQPGPQEYRALHILRVWCQRGDIDTRQGVKKEDMLTGLVSDGGMKRKDAWQMVKRLWRCQLIQRMGVIHPISGRPQNQKWIF